MNSSLSFFSSVASLIYITLSSQSVQDDPLCNKSHQCISVSSLMSKFVYNIFVSHSSPSKAPSSVTQKSFEFRRSRLTLLVSHSLQTPKEFLFLVKSTESPWETPYRNARHTYKEVIYEAFGGVVMSSLRPTPPERPSFAFFSFISISPSPSGYLATSGCPV